MTTLTISLSRYSFTASTEQGKKGDGSRVIGYIHEGKFLASEGVLSRSMILSDLGILTAKSAQGTPVYGGFSAEFEGHEGTSLLRIGEDALGQYLQNTDVSELIRAVNVPFEERNVVSLPTSLIVVLGQMGWGKTWLLKRGVAALNPDLISYVVYGEMAEDRADLGAMVQSPSELLELIALWYISGSKKALTIDSLRDLVYRTSEGTGRGGMSQHLWAQLSFLANLMAMRGKLLFAALNPGAVAGATYSDLITASASSVSTLAFTANRQVRAFLRGPGYVDRPITDLRVADLSVQVDEQLSAEDAAPKVTVGVPSPYDGLSNIILRLPIA